MQPRPPGAPQRRLAPRPPGPGSAILVALAAWVALATALPTGAGAEDAQPTPGAPAGTQLPLPIGLPGRTVTYRHTSEPPLAPSVVREWTLTSGPLEPSGTQPRQWLHFRATKSDGGTFQTWVLAAAYPPPGRAAATAAIDRYLLREGAGPILEFRDRVTAAAVLPSVAGWRQLFPRDRDAADSGAGFFAASAPAEAHLLGHRYRQVSSLDGPVPAAPAPDRTLALLPDVLVGLPSNQRQKDETRRYDGSDYEYVRFTRADYRQMAGAGFNCFRVDAEQLPWVEELDAFYWGLGPAQVPFPEGLYRSTYLGPALFLDEPAVGTRDHVLRPRLAREPDFRRDLTPRMAFDAFRAHYDEVLHQGAPVQLRRALAGQPGIDLGTLQLAQANLYSWETMVATAGYQLSRDPEVPTALVFEPPGRVGTRRVVPELNLSYGCQLAIDDSRHLTDVIYGFLRGAARATGKSWGTSIYGAVEPADAPVLLTRAYDLGATRFFFWDNYQLACVPYSECLALARLLRAHAEAHPRRDLDRLRRAAETAIVIPAGYNLGHVHLGRGNLWGLGELNLERRNPAGVTHRAVMAACFAEIERCFRLGTAFDLLWDLPEITPSGYREIVRIREDGRVGIETGGRTTLLDAARIPPRPEGAPPGVVVALSSTNTPARAAITATAEVTETTAPVYYTTGADPRGVYHNAVVDWELFGPRDEDYRQLAPANHQPRVVSRKDGFQVLTTFRLDQPGTYRLRAAAGDRAGRTTVVWTTLRVTE